MCVNKVQIWPRKVKTSLRQLRNECMSPHTCVLHPRRPRIPSAFAVFRRKIRRAYRFSRRPSACVGGDPTQYLSYFVRLGREWLMIISQSPCQSPPHARNLCVHNGPFGNGSDFDARCPFIIAWILTRMIQRKTGFCSSSYKKRLELKLMRKREETRTSK